MMAEPRYFAVKFAVDLSCVLLVGIPILIFKFAVTPFKRGFFCDDDSIRHPFKDSTVTSIALYFVGTTLNLIAFLILEFIRSRQLQLPPQKVGRFIIPGYLWSLYAVVGVFAFGCCVSQLTTDIAKYIIGRLRPHFISVCYPEGSGFRAICRPGVDQHLYVTNFECTGNPDLIREARLSFPSGHSSFSAFTMVFLALYLQSRMPWKRARILRTTLQFVSLMLAMATALSRVSDYKHHWSDVLAGSFQGTVVALLIVFFVSNFFHQGSSTSKVFVHQDQQTLEMRTVIPNQHHETA